MSIFPDKPIIKITKTLYFNTFRCIITDEMQDIHGAIKVIPGLPLDRNELPPDAPEAHPFLTVIIEDANVTKETLLDFEDKLSSAIIERFKTEDFIPVHCEFFYPSPAFLFEDSQSTVN